VQIDACFIIEHVDFILRSLKARSDDQLPCSTANVSRSGEVAEVEPGYSFFLQGFNFAEETSDLSGAPLSSAGEFQCL
jgi:hypothetical protein